MRYQVLATDFDGTLAHDGRVSQETLAALQRFIASGRRLILVTGRELPQLQSVFPELHLFHWVVAENGGLLYEPSTKKEILVGNPPSQALVETLYHRGVSSISVGRCIIATWSPFENTVLEAIRDLGLELQIIFNKGAVMVLPAGVNKAFGLEQALKEMKLSTHNTVGVGDAENDHAFLQVCEFSAVVANALPSLKEVVDVVLSADHGRGVELLIDSILTDDLRSFEVQTQRRKLPIATSDSGEVFLPLFGAPILVCGASGSGKSSLANKIVDSIAEQSYQFCIIDPEGDYESFDGAVVLGGPNSIPPIDEAIHVLEDPNANVVICLTGVPIPDRPPFFLQLIAGLLQLRIKTGRPHWLILDEAHHLIPADWLLQSDWLPENWVNAVLITVQPSLLPVFVLKQVELVALVGIDAEKAAGDFAAATQVEQPKFPEPLLTAGELWLWQTKSPSSVIRCRGMTSLREHVRHRRKYAEGQLAPEKSFYFRGPEGKLNLRAQNLILFCQLADGVDDETWEFHLRNGDYTKWLQSSIKDESLAAEASRICDLKDLAASETKNLLLTAIKRDYTLAATSNLTVPGAS
jgi:HAD superfamily hydrolase (TIGR01484 family)